MHLLTRMHLEHF